MFCYQCEQAACGSGCTTRGVCGKSAEVSDLHDLLVEVAAGVSAYALALPDDDVEAGRFVVQALFTTVTNVNFTDESIAAWIRKGVALRDRLAKASATLPDASRTSALPPCATFTPPDDIPGMADAAAAFGIVARQKRLGDDKAGVLYMVIYGLKGAAAYLDHASRLGVEDPSVYRMFHETLALTCAEPDDMNVLLEAALKAGEINLKATELLDRANTSRFGHPEPTSVRVTPVAGKCILVSGHDLLDLYDLLVATEGKGINIYTHSEMLPCNVYPVMKNFAHLVGNYGGAWQEQQREFADFPGPILLTTNCLMPPQSAYKDRVFTTGLVSYPGVTHLENGRFEPLLDAALAMPGFAEDAPEHRITIGFARKAVLNVADQVVGAVKAGLIRHFFLIGGCDGAKPGRNYYTEFAEKTPPDTVILTLACGKYRFNKLDFGDIGGIPRLLDVGQCNDAYSAVQVAVALANAFGCGVNDLPLSFVLSWYEQKAVAILLALLHLGVRNIRLGPSLPAFATPAVLEVLGSTFGLSPITTPDEDLALSLGG
ncbi:MAG: hydroxylamine reductase [Planctomycetaceae bacterium]|nr:hydroxylamine reductase [Planctomycetaceae bacterium]